MKSLSRVQFFATPWTVAHQAPLSMGFSRQEYWSGVPLPSPGMLLDIPSEQDSTHPPHTYTYTHTHTHTTENYSGQRVSSAKAEKPPSTGGDNGLQWPQARGFLCGHSMGSAGLLPQPWSPVQCISRLLQPLDLICKELSHIPGCLVDLLLSKDTRYANLKFQRDQERPSKKREEMLLAKAINAASTP